MKCTDKEWQHCRVEKMGCPGCYYDEIEVGEWIRNKDGYIDKVKKIINPDEYMEEKYYCCESTMASSYRSQIEKLSKDKIDLVKKGDYVNGHLIVKIRIDPFNNKKQLFTEHWDYNWQGDGTLLVLYDEDIKNILTHEQYLENCFEVMQE